MEALFNHHHHVEEEEDDGLAVVMRKRVMVVIDDPSPSNSKHAILWAMTHVVNSGDLLILLHIIPQTHHHSNFANNYAYLPSFCRGCKPQVEVETVVIKGPRLATVMNQVKKLDVSVLILDHTKPPSPFFLCRLCGSRWGSDDFVEECIKSVENCLTVGVRKQKRGIGGYLITTKWQTNFWVLA